MIQATISARAGVHVSLWGLGRGCSERGDSRLHLRDVEFKVIERWHTNFWREGGDGFGVFLSQGILALLFLRTWMIGADLLFPIPLPSALNPFSRKLCILGWRYDTPPVQTEGLKKELYPARIG